MKKRNLAAFFLCAGLGAAMLTTAGAEEPAETEGTAVESAETNAADPAADAGEQLAAPTDFTFDPATGEYSFTAVDDRIGYYFVRVYHVEDGVETGEYVASSQRINGKTTGEVTGTIDMSGASWGEYHINLVSFVPAGTDYEKPATQSILARYGIDETLERPEMMVMASGSQAELIVDWYTLADYSYYQYMPEMTFTFYSDAECTQEVLSDTVDLNDLMDTLDTIPPANGYIWGWGVNNGQHYYHIGGDTGDDEGQGAGPGPGGPSGEIDVVFRNDLYTYTLDPGTYYVTCQALSRDEYITDSQVSTPVEITLTEGESTEEYTFATTELWKDPTYGMERIYASPGMAEGRVDAATGEITGMLLD